MVATTPIAGLRYSQQSDVANAETGFSNLASDVDNKLIPRYATVAARAAAIPSPINGQAAYVTDTASGGHTLSIYDGTSWVPHFRSPLFAYKTASETINNSAAQQNDDHLFVSVAANTIYTLEISIIYEATTAADIIYTISYPALTSVSVHSIAPGDAATTGGNAESTNFIARTNDATSPTVVQSAGGVGAGTEVTALIKGLVVVGNTAGTVQFRWAQGVAGLTDAIVKQNSYIRLDRVV